MADKPISLVAGAGHICMKLRTMTNTSGVLHAVHAHSFILKDIAAILTSASPAGRELPCPRPSSPL